MPFNYLTCNGGKMRVTRFTATEIIFYLLLPSCIILTLTLVYCLPGGIKELLALKYYFFSFSDPSDLMRLYTYHLVHYDHLHFTGNVISFILIYWVLTHLVIQGKETTTFKVMLLIIFVAIAPALGVLDLLLLSDTVVR